MLVKTNYSVPLPLLRSIPFSVFQSAKTTINQPTGDFFYQSWVIKQEYRNTVFAQLLDALPTNIGEARVIVLESERCYTKHADIDDRYHMNLHGDEGYLIDLESNTMHHTIKDGFWYLMDAGILHTAASFGEDKRIQVVVRKLLVKNKLVDPVSVSITSIGKNPRYKFDTVMSPWLNAANKNKTISNFQRQDNAVVFDVEQYLLIDLRMKCIDNFILQEIK